MALNKNKKLVKSKKHVTPQVHEPIEELDEELDEELEEELDEEEDEEEEEEEEEVKPVKKSKKAASVKTDDDDDDDDETISFDTDSIVNGIVTDKQKLTSSVYQVQLRLPSDIEPMYKGLTPRVKKALRDAFAELVRKTYDKLH